MQPVSLILTLCGAGESQKKRDAYDNEFLRKAKIRIMAYKNAFDGIWTPDEIRQAKLKGNIAKGYNVHHIRPLGTEESTFDLDNMVVMDRRSHTWLHREIYDPALSLCQVGQSCAIWLPEMDVNKVIRWQDIEEFAKEYTEYRKKYYGGVNVPRRNTTAKSR